MTQEEEQILLRDLCARVPYVTFVYIGWQEIEELEIYDDCGENKEEPNIHTLISCNYFGECVLDNDIYKTIYNIKPYLRPLSSMTEEEKKEIQLLKLNLEASSTDVVPKLSRNMFWYYEHHFDVNGLIPIGLALEAPEGMYNT